MKWENKKTRVLEIDDEVSELDNRIRQLKTQKETIYKTCLHIWGETTYTPDIEPSRYFPGDPEGTMGIDRQLPFWSQRKETPKWTRVCKECGLTEVTDRVNEQTIKTPKF